MSVRSEHLSARPRRYESRFVDVRVERRRAMTPRMWEIRLRGPALRVLRVRPGAHVPVEVPVDGCAPVLRTYSVWTHDGTTASLVLCVSDHRPGGPGSRWAASATVGQRLRIGLPRNKISLEPAAPYHVFLGEETAAVPLLTMLAALPATARAHAVFETVDHTTELSTVEGRPVRWVHRGQASPVNSAVLLRAARALELPRVPGVAYVAGEAATCRALARHLVGERGWPRRAIRVQTHWNAGRTGLLPR